MGFWHQKNIWVGFLAAISIVIWLAVASFINSRKYKTTAQWVAHTNEVLFHTAQLHALALQMESDQRGYTITGNKIFAKLHEEAVTKLQDHLKDLKQLTRDNPSQQQRIQTLDELIDKKLEFSEKVLLARNINFEEAAKLNSSLVGKVFMDDIKRCIDSIKAEENKLLKQRKLLSEQDIHRFNLTFTSLLITTIIILSLVFYAIYINFKKRNKAEQELKVASEHLQDMYDNASCGYHSLNADGYFVNINNTWLSWLGYNSKQSIINTLRFSDIITDESQAKFKEYFPKFVQTGEINDVEFEIVRKDGTTFPVLLSATALYDKQGKFIKSRSTVFHYLERKVANDKIKQLNHELEAFSYSVSHDLRAPLRSIDGYSRILLEDHEEHLDEEGKRVLKIIINNARRMGNLIDDLLDFSRIGRKEIAVANVKMDSMVKTVFKEVIENEKDREIDYKIKFLEPCVADPNLIRQVWVNLISNAVKYTRKKNKACIEVSSDQRPGEVVYSIRDNGTGFDMQYSHKLFGVFQRLHRQQDFEGTGVGLAIVQRIVNRHGGKVWAEGKVDEGSIFYFSIPHEKIG